MQVTAYAIGVLALGVLWLLAGMATGKWNPLDLIEGADRRLSTSKFQFFLWTAVVFFSYVALTVVRVWRHEYSPLDGIPENVLLVMGFSAGTATAAKAITTSYVASGQLLKPPADASSPANLVADDTNFPELAKIQSLGWTMLAIVLYLFYVFHAVHLGANTQDATTLPKSLPDIGDVFMVLTGLANGTYLGKKLVSTAKVRLVALAPTTISSTVGGLVTISGISLNLLPAATNVTMDGQILASKVLDNGAVQFTVPPNTPPGQKVIGLTVGGVPSDNTLSLLVLTTNITLTSLAPAPVQGAAGGAVTINGIGLDLMPAGTVVMVDALALPGVVANGAVTFNVPPNTPPGQKTIRVIVGGLPSDNSLILVVQ